MSDAAIVRKPLLVRQNDTGAQDVREALAALARMEEREKNLLGKALLFAHERDQLQGALWDLRRETKGMPDELDRLKDQLATLEDSHKLTVAALEKEEDEVDRLKDQLAEADANGLRLAEEVERLKSRLDFTRGVADSAVAEVERLREANEQLVTLNKESWAEVKRLRAALNYIIDLEGSHTKPNTNEQLMVAEARRALEGSTSEVRS